jgi:hypothetical protein
MGEDRGVGTQSLSNAGTAYKVHDCLNERQLWTRIWQGLAVASLVVNLLAIAFEGGYAFLGGLVAVAIAPLVIYKQEKLQRTDSTYARTHLTDSEDCPYPLISSYTFDFQHCELYKTNSGPM